jgi:hypothetical protein
MAKTCPKCQHVNSDVAKFCGACRYILDSAPNPTCQRGHPILPGATSCPICDSMAVSGGGRVDTVAENIPGRGQTQVDPSLLPGGGMQGRPAPGPGAPNTRGGTAVLGGSAAPATGRPGSAPTGRTGTVVAPPPGAPSQPQQLERKIVAVLVTYDTKPSGDVFPVRVGRNRIGRENTNEICIANDNAMSGTNTYVHFYEGSGSFVITDANSQNGTFVDGKNLEGDSVKANNYATIRAGITQFHLIMVQPPAAAPESGKE